MTVHTAYEHRRIEVIVPVGLEVDLEQAGDVFCRAVAGIEGVLKEPPPEALAWEFSNNNVNIRVRWWAQSQRAHEVRTRAAAVKAIKRASEEARIPLPADTKISFADTPLLFSERKAPVVQRNASKKSKRRAPSHAAKSRSQTNGWIPRRKRRKAANSIRG